MHYRFSTYLYAVLPCSHYADLDAVVCGVGRLHFVKFETSRVEDCIDFISAKGLHRLPHGPPGATMRVKATGEIDWYGMCIKYECDLGVGYRSMF